MIHDTELPQGFSSIRSGRVVWLLRDERPVRNFFECLSMLDSVLAKVAREHSARFSPEQWRGR